MVTIKYGLIQISHNIRQIKPYKYDTNVEDINPKICVMMSAYGHELYNSVLY